MELTLEQIRHIAALAKLELKPEEEESLCRQVSGVLDFVGQLAECRTEGVEPMSHVLPDRNGFRPDEVVPADPAVRSRLLEAFPEKEGNLLKVKSVFS